jgi:hypothetical protein
MELSVFQRSVTKTLNRRFGLQQPGAEYYRETRENILAKMVKGSVIHADETQIKLPEKTAYVWVFAT